MSIRTRTRFRALVAVVAAAALPILGMTMTASTATAADNSPNLTIPLNNDTAEQGTDCPATGGPYWHFVISPNNGDSYFITFHLNLGDATTYDTSIFVPNGDQLDNVFLPVPSGKTLTSLNKDGSTADIWWNGTGTAPAKFQLSHVCSVTPKKDLTVTKTATPSYTRTFDWTITKTATPAQVYSAGGGTSEPSTFTVAVTKDAGTDSTFAVSGTITVANPNGFAVDGVVLTDTIDNGGICTVKPATVDVAANSDATADYTCSFDTLPAPGTNTASAFWTDFGSPSTSASATAAYAFDDPTTLVNDTVHVTDTNGQTWDFSASGSQSYQMTYTDPVGICTTHENTATIEGLDKSASASVTDCQGADLTVTKTAKPSYTRTYGWDITKSADAKTVYTANGGESQPVTYTVEVTKDNGTDSLWKVAGVITVTNPSDWQDVTLTGLTDTVDNGGICTVEPGPYEVKAGKSLEVGYSCLYSEAPTTSGGTNTAVATWDKAAAHTPDGSATGEATFAFSDPTTVVNDEVKVTDSFGGPWTFDTSDSVTYSKTFTDPAGTCTTHNNTATITETGDSASQAVTDCQVADPKVSKTAVPEFTRTFAWDITKDVDKTRFDGIVGKQATFNYTVNVTHNSGTDSAWVVSGKITVDNPTDWEPITLTSIADAVDNGGTCTVDPAPMTIPAKGSQDYSYTCTFAAAPAPSTGTNTASVTWDSLAPGLDSGFATGTADFAFDTPTTLVDGTVHVTDTFGGTLGTVSWADTSPTSFVYAHAFAVPAAGTCKSYDNRAEITENGKYADQSVKVCGWNAALTPGYWKTHLIYDSKHSVDPYTGKYLTLRLGGYAVDSTAKATLVFNAMNCGVAGDQNAVGCLAGHLLASELNVANQAYPTSISATIDKANAFLISVNYVGPSGKYKLSASQRAYAITLQTALDRYNNGLL